MGGIRGPPRGIYIVLSVIDIQRWFFGFNENIDIAAPVIKISLGNNLGLVNLRARSDDQILHFFCTGIFKVNLWEVVSNVGTETLLRYGALLVSGSSEVVGKEGSLLVYMGREENLKDNLSSSDLDSRTKNFIHFLRGEAKKAMLVSPNTPKVGKNWDDENIQYRIYSCIYCGSLHSDITQHY